MKGTLLARTISFHSRKNYYKKNSQSSIISILSFSLTLSLRNMWPINKRHSFVHVLFISLFLHYFVLSVPQLPVTFLSTREQQSKMILNLWRWQSHSKFTKFFIIYINKSWSDTRFITNRVRTPAKDANLNYGKTQEDLVTLER